MTLLTMTIPDDPAGLAVWLEERLVAPDFARFVAELTALHPDTPGDRQPARELLGRWTVETLDQGLGRLPPDLLRHLLRQPSNLIDLQELVLAEGGSYWDEVLRRQGGLQAAFDRGRRSLDAIVGSEAAENQGVPGRWQRLETPPARVAEADREPDASATGKRVRLYRRLAVFSTALAACLAIVVGVLVLRPSKPPEGPTPAIAWGWAKPGGIPSEAQQPPRQYLEQLASAAEEWFKKRPEDAPGLAKRLNEFRTGCSQLIFAEHAPLAKADRLWLVERCRVWAGKLDAHLAALESGEDPAQVRAKADDTVKALIQALRDRAGKVQSG
jgi:hypothetical protein